MTNFVLTSTLWRHWRRGWGCRSDGCCWGWVLPGWSGSSGRICSVGEGCSERGKCPAGEPGPGRRRRPWLGLIEHCWSGPEPGIEWGNICQREGRGRLSPGCWCWSDGGSLRRFRPCRWPSPCLSSTYRNISGDTPGLRVWRAQCGQHQQRPRTTTATSRDLRSDQSSKPNSEFDNKQQSHFDMFRPGHFYWNNNSDPSCIDFNISFQATNLIKNWNNNFIRVSLKARNRIKIEIHDRTKNIFGYLVWDFQTLNI